MKKTAMALGFFAATFIVSSEGYADQLGSLASRQGYHEVYGTHPTLGRTALTTHSREVGYAYPESRRLGLGSGLGLGLGAEYLTMPQNGHKLTESQKQWVKQKHPESIEREGKTGKGVGCNPLNQDCATKKLTNKPKRM